MKKRSGSTVLTVLAISMVLMLLGGVILNMLLATTRGNEDSNRRQDLKYGAEGGLEIARSYIAKNGYKEIDNAAIEVEINKNAEILTEAKAPKSNVTKMEIELNPLREDIINASKVTGVEIVSKASYLKNGKTNEEQLKMKYKIARGHDGNFMDHGLVGGEGGIQMNDNASANLEGTSVSTGVGGVKYPTANGSSVTKPDPSNEHKNNFGKLQFKNEGRASKINAQIVHEGKINFDKSDGLTMDEVKIRIETAENKTKTIIEGSTEDPKTYIGKLKAPIIKLEIIEGAKGDDLYMYNPKIYIINSERFNMNLIGSIGVFNTIIINSGEMKIEGNGAIDMQNSTFIANKIETGMNVAMHIKGQPNKVDNNQYGVFSKEEEAALNELINVLIPNWKENNTGGSDENLIIEEGSYE